MSKKFHLMPHKHNLASQQVTKKTSNLCCLKYRLQITQPTKHADNVGEYWDINATKIKKK